VHFTTPQYFRQPICSIEDPSGCAEIEIVKIYSNRPFSSNGHSGWYRLQERRDPVP
jgi:hypothetical protein